MRGLLDVPGNQLCELWKWTPVSMELHIHGWQTVLDINTVDTMISYLDMVDDWIVARSEVRIRISMFRLSGLRLPWILC